MNIYTTNTIKNVFRARIALKFIKIYELNSKIKYSDKFHIERKFIDINVEPYQ